MNIYSFSIVELSKTNKSLRTKRKHECLIIEHFLYRTFVDFQHSDQVNIEK